MKLLLIGGLLVGAGVIVIAMTNNSGVPQSGTYPAFGMPLYAGANGSGGPGAYGMAYYGGHSTGNSGYWKPNMLEGK